jgi:hypothetical protein
MRTFLTASAVVLAAACASPTPYKPASSPADTGYETTKLETDTFRVIFEGNEVTPRETVETYILYRAAQLTEETGHEYFRFVSRDVDEMIDLDTYQTVETIPGFYDYDVGYGFTGYPYYTTFPYGADMDLTETRIEVDDSYRAQAVIETYSQQPPDMTGVLDASDVIARLDAQIDYPGGGGAATPAGSY